MSHSRCRVSARPFLVRIATQTRSQHHVSVGVTPMSWCTIARSRAFMGRLAAHRSWDRYPKLVGMHTFAAIAMSALRAATLRFLSGGVLVIGTAQVVRILQRNIRAPKLHCQTLQAGGLCVVRIPTASGQAQSARMRFPSTDVLRGRAIIGQPWWIPGSGEHGAARRLRQLRSGVFRTCLFHLIVHVGGERPFFTYIFPLHIFSACVFAQACH